MCCCGQDKELKQINQPIKLFLRSHSNRRGVRVVLCFREKSFHILIAFSHFRHSHFPYHGCTYISSLKLICVIRPIARYVCQPRRDGYSLCTAR